MYVKFSPALYAHCRRFLRSPAAARDATQEAFVRVLARGKVLPRDQDALCYLYRVATNVCLNVLREEIVHRRAERLLVTKVANVPGAESRCSDREFVLAVFARCGRGGAEVAVMHYLDGLSQVETAKALGVARKTVFNRLRKMASIAGSLLHAMPRFEAATATNTNRGGRSRVA